MPYLLARIKFNHHMRIIILVLLISILVSCGIDKEFVLDYDSVPKSNLKPKQEIDLFELGVVTALGKKNDLLLFRRNTAPFFCLYDWKNKMQYNFGMGGEDNNFNYKTFHFINFDTEKNEEGIWLVDDNTKDVYCFPLKEILSGNPDPKPIKTFNYSIPRMIDKCFIINDTLIYVSEIASNNSLIKYNPKTQQLLSAYGPYEERYAKAPSVAFSLHGVLSKDKSKIFIAYRLQNGFSIFDTHTGEGQHFMLKNDEFQKIRTVNEFFPAPSAQLFFGFPCSYNKLFYAPFYKSTTAGTVGTENTKILVIDDQGNLIKWIYLDQPVSRIVVDKEGIFAMSRTKEGVLLVY